MSLPDQPSTPGPASPPDQSWWWRLEDASGAEVEITGQHSGQRFVSQGDAESWVGEIWAELVEVGVGAVTLFEHERRVYGPMSLMPG